LDIVIYNVLSNESRGALDEVHDNKGAKLKRVVGRSTPRVDLGHWYCGPLPDETQGLHFHGNLLVRIVIVDPSYTGICRHVCSVATQKYLVTTEQDIDGPFRDSLNCQTSRLR
jgi:hypothetical protein